MQSTNERYHWAASALLFLVAAERLGVPKQRVIEHAEIDPGELRPWRFRIPWVPLRALTRSAIELTGESGLGLLAGMEGTNNYHGAVGAYYMHNTPVREALRLPYEEVLPRVSNILRLWYEVEGDQVLYCTASIPPEDPLFEPHLHLVLTQQILAIRMLFGEETRITRVSLRAKALGDAEGIARRIGCPIELGQARDCLVGRRDLLERPMPLADPVLRELLRPEFEAFLAKLDMGLEWTLAVQGILERAVASGLPTDVSTVAGKLKLKPRALRMRLASESSTYLALLEKARKDYTLRQLAQPGVKLAAVAAQVGFSDPAAFTRAFRRWTGLTPREWQVQHGRAAADDFGANT